MHSEDWNPDVDSAKEPSDICPSGVTEQQED